MAMGWDIGRIHAPPEPPVVIGSADCWLKDLSFPGTFSGFPTTKVTLAPGYAPDMTLKISFGKFKPVALEPIASTHEFEVLLRTLTSSPEAADSRDVFRFPVIPTDWKLRSDNPRNRAGYCSPYWAIKLSDGMGTLHLTKLFTSDLDMVLKTCRQPLEVVLRYKKEPVIMKSHHNLTVNVEVEHYTTSKFVNDLPAVTKDIEARLKSILSSSGLISGYDMDRYVHVTGVKVRAESQQPGKPTNWRDVFDGNKVRTSEFEARIEAAAKAGYAYVALGDQVYGVECSRAASQPVCKVSDLK